MNPQPQLPGDRDDTVDRAVGTTERLVLSVAETVNALGLSDDLVYELTERGELPCLRFGRRRSFPARLSTSSCGERLSISDPDVVIGRLVGIDDATPVAGQGAPRPPIYSAHSRTQDNHDRLGAGCSDHDSTGVAAEIRPSGGDGPELAKPRR